MFSDSEEYIPGTLDSELCFCNPEAGTTGGMAAALAAAAAAGRIDSDKVWYCVDSAAAEEGGIGRDVDGSAEDGRGAEAAGGVLVGISG